MARRHKHEEHANHEAWAIPYGDLITLLLAFFVVMYAMSSVNEGKYRVLSDSLVAAFRGAPQHARADPGRREAGRPGADLGDQHRAAADDRRSAAQHRCSRSQWDIRSRCRPIPHSRATSLRASRTKSSRRCRISSTASSSSVRRHGMWVEVEIRTDILFPSGVATLSPAAEQVLQQLARDAQAVPEPDPRRRPHRQSSDQHARRSRRTGSCRRRARRASCICSRAPASIPRGSR